MYGFRLRGAARMATFCFSLGLCMASVCVALRVWRMFVFPLVYGRSREMGTERDVNGMDKLMKNE